MDFIAVLNYTRKQYREALTDETLTLIDRAITELDASGVVQQSLQVGDRIPDFTLPNVEGALIEIQELMARGPVLITFFRGIWCPFCSLELQALEQILPAVQALGASIVAISPQKQRYSLTMIEQYKLTFDILSDQGHQVARQFGLVYTVPDYLRPVFEQGGYPLPRYNGDESFELPIPATFLVDQDGIIVHTFASADYTERVDPVEFVTVLRKTIPVVAS